ncbi:endonuclease domain-containing protein [Asticcacaulis sp. AC460]|uniref:endonuclease domain-containing protein n=1 Tax=Asticcacaulis sp. AC460 TaxID=1282360 RepID=UPI0009DEA620|nr:DUF559 domain-containing protein [Asticcacaulis sp. AC460]
MKRDIRKLALAKQMRRQLTTPEYLLWERLKRRDGDGIAFRRQHPKGPYILDFYCHRVRLCVEIDGALHDSDQDERRDRWLNTQGIEVYRIHAAEVFGNPDEVAESVWAYVKTRLSDK